MDTNTTRTGIATPPELRVTIVVPFELDPFEQARQLAILEPAIRDFEKQLPIDATVDRRIVRPKPPKASTAEGSAA